MKIYRNLKYKLSSFFRKKVIIPGYEYKRSEIDKYREQHKLKVLVETGTFLGDTVDYFKDKFERVYSIELSEDLASRAQNRFKNDLTVQIIKGDSGVILKDLVKKINQPILFWLDGHYSSEFFVGEEFIKTAKGKINTPILDELRIILRNNLKHIILIDDARLFIGKYDYPTIAELQDLIKCLNPNYLLSTRNDIIYIQPHRESVK